MGTMRVSTTIPKEKAKAFTHKLVKALSGNHDVRTVAMIDRLNRQLTDWAGNYKFAGFAAY